MKRRVLIVGLGLIGGSIGLRLRRGPEAWHVRGVDADADVAARALRGGATDEALCAEDAARAGWFGPGMADVCVLATPVTAVASVLDLLEQAGFDGVVTDVCSTKRAVVAAAESHAHAPYSFVGGHPMAGSERSGIDAASAELFERAYWVLTPTRRSSTEAIRVVHQMVRALGARPITVRPERHDEAVARISHLPHITASALVALAANAQESGQDVLRLAAGGFKDMTRIAAGSPDLWTGICMDNAEPIASSIEELCSLLREVAQALNERDHERVRRYFADAAEVRRSLPARWVPASTTLYVLEVPMVDRPGVLGEITATVGACGCNIEDIEIDHESEDRAVLRLVLTDEGDREGLIEALRRRGYDARLAPLSQGG